MPIIRSLRANVTREEAIAQFSPGGPAGAFRFLVLGPLRSIADFYIPFRLFRVEVRNSGKLENSILGLDAVTGSLDLYYFAAIPAPPQLVTLETRNCPGQRLPAAQQRQMVIEKSRRTFFSRGFFRVRDLSITADPLPDELHIPYWVGFHGSDGRVRISIIDAIRRRHEGAKVRHLLQTWIKDEFQLAGASPDATVLR
jgi:hypothetical protein